MKQRVLVTGHKGFIGRNMSSWLVQQGYDVDGWEWELNDFPKVENYDWVVHLGAVTRSAEQDVDMVMLRNFEFSQQLFNACNRYGTHLQYASSSRVYGTGKNFSETAPCYPHSPYAWSKYLFDRWVFRQPMNIMVQGFRYFNVYGKWMHLRNEHANFIHKCQQQAKENGYIAVSPDSEHLKRDWTWVGDVCKIHTTFMQTVVGSGLWNVGSGLTHSLLDIAEAVAAPLNVPVIKLPDSAPNKDRQLVVCANLDHLKETIGKTSWLNVYEWIETE